MKKPKLMTQLQLAELLGVSRQTVSAWKREGQDMSDLDALRARAAAVVAKATGAEGYIQARTRKTRAEADRAETLAARERGELIDASTLTFEFEAIGRLFRYGVTKLENDLPPQLAGRPASEIKKVLSHVFREVLTELSHSPAHRHIQQLIDSAP
jgi:transcriptional regulator with XRE-family HTH domain